MERQPTIGEMLRDWRVRRGITQEQAAFTLSVSVYTYVSWENGRRTPKNDNSRRIDALLGEGE